jgi:hypothetical protein
MIDIAKINKKQGQTALNDWMISGFDYIKCVTDGGV